MINAIVVNEITGDYVALVSVKNGEVQYYTLKDNEVLVYDTYVPRKKKHATSSGYIKPILVDGTWEESATAEEIATFELNNPTPVKPVHPKVLQEQRLTELEISVIENGQFITELELLRLEA